MGFLGRIIKNRLGYEIVEYSGLVLYVLTLAILIPLTLGLAFGGFESFTNKIAISFYYGFVILGLLGFLALEIRAYFQRKAIDKGIFSFPIIHDPDEKGVITFIFDSMHLNFISNIIRNPIKFWLVTLIFFTFISIFAVQSNIVLPNAVPNIVAQQISPVAIIGYQIEPSSTAETVGGAFFFSILMGLWYFILKRFGIKDKTTLIILLAIGVIFFIAPLFGLSWMSYHTLVYGTSEINLFATFLFGYFNAILMGLFGSSITFFTWHLANNAVLALLKNLARETVLVNLIIFLVVLTIITITYISLTLKQKTAKEVNLF